MSVSPRWVSPGPSLHQPLTSAHRLRQALPDRGRVSGQVCHLVTVCTGPGKQGRVWRPSFSGPNKDCFEHGHGVSHLELSSTARPQSSVPPAPPPFLCVRPVPVRGSAPPRSQWPVSMEHIKPRGVSTAIQPTYPHFPSPGEQGDIAETLRCYQ